MAANADNDGHYFAMTFSSGKKPRKITLFSVGKKARDRRIPAIANRSRWKLASIRAYSSVCRDATTRASGILGYTGALVGEYLNPYEKMARSIDDDTSSFDLRPKLHIAEASMPGKRKHVDPFHF